MRTGETYFCKSTSSRHHSFVHKRSRRELVATLHHDQFVLFTARRVRFEINFEGCSFGRCCRTYKFSIFHFWSSDQRATSTRARTDGKNPFHTSTFRESPPCFKGSNLTRAAKSIRFSPSRRLRTPLDRVSRCYCPRFERVKSRFFPR